MRVGAIAASGLAALPFGPFLGGLVVGNGLFVGAHFALGLVVGPPALGFVAASSGPLLALGALVLLAALGALGWLAIRRRRSARAAGDATRYGDELGDVDGLAAWADAACPACIAVSLMRGEI